MAHSKKRKFFHVLNARARKKEREQNDREEEKYQELHKDPRRDHLGQDLTRLYPLVEEE